MNTPKSDYFFDAPPPAFGQGWTTPDTKRRTFTGVAYSGALVSDGWQSIVIDLASLTLPDPCPTLLQHDRAARVGVCTLAVRDGALACDGHLLSNEAAVALAADADEGFPWQLSVHAEPGTTEELAPGVAVQINGRAFTGPLTIFRHTAIRELSFTPTGVDGATSARVWSAPLPTPPHEAHTMPSTDSAQADQLAALTAQVADLTVQLSATQTRAEAAETALAAHVKAVRLSVVRATFGKLGRQVSEAESAIYLALDEPAWEQVSRDLLAAKPAAPAHLFSEQATGDPGDAPSLALSLSAIYSARRREVTQ